MGAVLQPFNPEVTNTNPSGEDELTPVSHVERLADYNLPRALSQIATLESEVTQLLAEARAMQEALARAEHRLVNREQLLRNARIREFELRAQLVRELP